MALDLIKKIVKFYYLSQLFVFQVDLYFPLTFLLHFYNLIGLYFQVGNLFYNNRSGFISINKS